MNENTSPFRILSLDGGGVRGLLSAKLLANIEQRLNQQDGRQNLPLGKRFDLITGTSTGGFIALALAAGANCQQIVEFYEEQLPRIFGSRNRRTWLGLFKPLYHAHSLQDALDAFPPFHQDEEQQTPKTLADVQTHVCIPSVALKTGPT